MDFLHIFTKPAQCNLWSTLYPGDKTDIFKHLFDQWNDTEYLMAFFKNNQTDLAFWNCSIDEAIDKVLDEAQHFNDELYAIETKHPGYENCTLRDVFKPLHTNIYSLKTQNEAHRKGKPNFRVPMLRIYAIELKDGCMIVTGGAIKLTREMDDSEKKNLSKVQAFLDQQQIDSRNGLIN